LGQLTYHSVLDPSHSYKVWLLVIVYFMWEGIFQLVLAGTEKCSGFR